jgi:hypothetical protein
VRTTHADGFSLLPVAVLGRGIGTRLGDIGSEKLKALFCASVTSERAGASVLAGLAAAVEFRRGPTCVT